MCSSDLQKAKVVPIDHLPQMAAGSERYTGYALDGLGQAPNEDELTSVPDLNHIVQLPWEPKIAWMPADNHFKGEPYPLSTRVALQNMQAEAAKSGVLARPALIFDRLTQGGTRSSVSASEILTAMKRGPGVLRWLRSEKLLHLAHCGREHPGVSGRGGGQGGLRRECRHAHRAGAESHPSRAGVEAASKNKN